MADLAPCELTHKVLPHIGEQLELEVAKAVELDETSLDAIRDFIRLRPMTRHLIEEVKGLTHHLLHCLVAGKGAR